MKTASIENENRMTCEWMVSRTSMVRLIAISINFSWMNGKYQDLVGNMELSGLYLPQTAQYVCEFVIRIRKSRCIRIMGYLIYLVHFTSLQSIWNWNSKHVQFHTLKSKAMGLLNFCIAHFTVIRNSESEKKCGYMWCIEFNLFIAISSLNYIDFISIHNRWTTPCT